MNGPASGIVLAGGKSRRLGRDKRALQLGSSRPQLEETVSRLSEAVAEVIVVAGGDLMSVADLLRAAPRLTSIVPDLQTGMGPLGGLCAGLQAARFEAALVVACDLPFLSVSVLRYLLDYAGEYDLLVPRRAGGRLEMLHAVYRRTCLPILRSRLERGQLSLNGAIGDLSAAGLKVQLIEDSEIARLDPRLQTFFNVNTPADLQEAERLLDDQ